MPAGLGTTKRIWLAIVALAFFASVGAFVGQTFFGRNWHEVIPGQVYRTAQLKPAQLSELVRRYGIQTVVNLRGSCPNFDWYIDESRTTHDLEIAQEDVTTSAVRLPSPTEIRRLVEILERTEYPILIHCRQGIDRTGLAAVMTLLLNTDTDLHQARKQLSIRYGHVPIGPTRWMQAFFDEYESWLALSQLKHSREQFRRWAMGGYCPAECSATMELVDRPIRVSTHEPFALTFRVTNSSPRPWQFKPGTETGICLKGLVFDPDMQLTQVQRAGLFRREVQPGESINLTLAISSLPRPGKYLIHADMIAPGGWAFVQMGSEPAQIEVIAETGAPSADDRVKSAGGSD